MSEEPSFQHKLLNELHGLRESLVRLETRFENFLEVREDVDDLKKKIQKIEVEQAIQKTKLWGIGAISGIIVSFVTNWIINKH